MRPTCATNSGTPMAFLNSRLANGGTPSLHNLLLLLGFFHRFDLFQFF